MDGSTVEHLATTLLEAYDARATLASLFAEHPSATLADAYAVQEVFIARRKERGGGDRIIGKKVGVTNKASQRRLGLESPVYGEALASGAMSPADSLITDRFVRVGVEPEIAFLLKDALHGPGVTTAAVLRATAGVMPAFEVVDQRPRSDEIRLLDMVAGNVYNAGIVVGGTLTLPDGLDLLCEGMVLEKNGEVIATAAGAAVHGGPVSSVAWLANELATRGKGLSAGEVIVTGGLGVCYGAKGDVVRAIFTRLGSVSISFE